LHGVAAPLPDLSIADWVVLGLVAENPTHGWPIVRALRADGPVGRVWTVPRPIVYRSLTTLTAAGYIEECRDPARSRGPQRTIVRVTRRGRAALRRWLDTPVEHVRDVRTELLVKLALLSRSGRPSRSLVEHQIAHLAPLVRAISGSADDAALPPTADDGFDLVLARWRREQALAVDRFLHSLLADAPP
jgi:DNA-binding PadR family transcriptional regulator